MPNNVKHLREDYQRIIEGWARTTKEVGHLLKPEDFLTTFLAWKEHRAIPGNPMLAQAAYDAALAYLLNRDDYPDAYNGGESS